MQYILCPHKLYVLGKYTYHEVYIAQRKLAILSSNIAATLPLNAGKLVNE